MTLNTWYRISSAILLIPAVLTFSRAVVLIQLEGVHLDMQEAVSDQSQNLAMESFAQSTIAIKVFNLKGKFRQRATKRNEIQRNPDGTFREKNNWLGKADIIKGYQARERLWMELPGLFLILFFLCWTGGLIGASAIFKGAKKHCVLLLQGAQYSWILWQEGKYFSLGKKCMESSLQFSPFLKWGNNGGSTMGKPYGFWWVV